MSPRVLVGVIGPADASLEEKENAIAIGREIAERGWVLLSGGRDAGVMAAANSGARRSGGLTVGILPDERGDVSPDVEIVIRTGLGSARNNIIALSADVLIACGAGAGTTSEIALGIKAGRPVVLLGVEDIVFDYFRRLGGELVRRAETAADATALVVELLSRDA
jgi:uncharacterized protein (TIGR00725 family)